MLVDKIKVRQRMITSGIESYSDLARRASLNPNTVYSVLDSSNWQSATVCKLAAALQCNPLDLITVDDGSGALNN